MFEQRKMGRGAKNVTGKVSVPTLMTEDETSVIDELRFKVRATSRSGVLREAVRRMAIQEGLLDA